MSKIVKEKETIVVQEYSLAWLENGGGYSFPCDEHGNVYFSEMTECAIANYNKCVNGEFPELIAQGIRTNQKMHKNPAVLLCNCGEHVFLIGNSTGACSCSCGQWYNVFGQELVNPEYWEESYDEE